MLGGAVGIAVRTHHHRLLTVAPTIGCSWILTTISNLGSSPIANDLFGLSHIEPVDLRQAVLHKFMHEEFVDDLVSMDFYFILRYCGVLIIGETGLSRLRSLWSDLSSVRSSH